LATALRFAGPAIPQQICTTKNILQLPTPDTSIIISRLAWPIVGPPFTNQITLNNATPITSPTIMCMNCESPPCEQISLCDAPNLFWTVEFNNLVVPPGPIELNDSPDLPPFFMIYFEPFIALPYSPPPRPTPPISQNESVPARLSLCDPCTSNNAYDKSPIVGTSVALGFTVALSICLVFYSQRKIKCPYCQESVGTAGNRMKEHFRDCQGHLMHYAPITIDCMQIVRESIEVHTQGDAEDEVARPEGIGPQPFRTL